jgi:acylphosphatase
MAMTEAAIALGVAGWVRNRRDGTVEALVQGEDAAIERVLAWCRRGPPGANVNAIATLARDVDPASDGFVCRATE